MSKKDLRTTKAERLSQIPDVVADKSDLIKSFLVCDDLIFWILNTSSSSVVVLAYERTFVLFFMRERYCENDSENAFIAFIFYLSDLPTVP